MGWTEHEGQEHHPGGAVCSPRISQRLEALRRRRPAVESYVSSTRKVCASYSLFSSCLRSSPASPVTLSAFAVALMSHHCGKSARVKCYTLSRCTTRWRSRTGGSFRVSSIPRLLLSHATTSASSGCQAARTFLPSVLQTQSLSRIKWRRRWFPCKQPPRGRI